MFGLWYKAGEELNSFFYALGFAEALLAVGHSSAILTDKFGTRNEFQVGSEIIFQDIISDTFAEALCHFSKPYKKDKITNILDKNLI